MARVEQIVEQIVEFRVEPLVFLRASPFQLVKNRISPDDAEDMHRVCTTSKLLFHIRNNDNS